MENKEKADFMVDVVELNNALAKMRIEKYQLRLELRAALCPHIPIELCDFEAITTEALALRTERDALRKRMDIARDECDRVLELLKKMSRL